MSSFNFDSADYDRYRRPASASRPPRKGRPTVLIVVVIAVVALGAVILLRDRQSPAPAPRPGADFVQHSATRYQGACLDSLYPSPPTFGAEQRDSIAGAVAGLARPAAVKNYTAVPGRPGLDLWVKAVYTNSLSTNNADFSAHVTVPAVSGLSQGMPTPGDPASDAWHQAYQQVVTEQTAADKGVEAGRSAVAGLGFPPYRDTASGISACMSTLLQLVHRDGPRTFLIATDCNEPVPPQLQGDFQGDPLIVVQTCVSGDAALCDGYYQTFVDRMRTLHVGQVTRYRPEEAGEAIRKWIQPEEGTP
jgi:hypothetical protein